MFVIWICMMIIPLISSRFMLLEVQDAKNINGNFDFLWILKWKDSVTRFTRDFSLRGKQIHFFSPFCIEVYFLCLLAFQKLDYQSHLQLHCWTMSVRADFSLNWHFSRICSVYYRPLNKMTGLGLRILLEFPALYCIYCIFTEPAQVVNRKWGKSSALAEDGLVPI